METNPYNPTLPDQLDGRTQLRREHRVTVKCDLLKATFVVLGAAVTAVIFWFGTWPGLGLFGVSMLAAARIRMWTFVPVLFGASIGYWRGSVLDARERSADSLDTIRALLTVSGGVIGYSVARFGGIKLLRAVGLWKDYGDLPFNVVLFVGVPFFAAAFALIGFWLGSMRRRRQAQRDATFTWTTAFTVLGAVVGNLVAMLGLYAVSNIFRLRNDVLQGIILLLFFLLAVVAFSALGFRRGCVLDRRRQGGDLARRWKPTLAATGVVVGTLMGYHVVYYVTLVNWAGDHWSRFFAWGNGFAQGMPIGGIVFCLLGSCLAEVLDRRSPPSEADSESTSSMERVATQRP